MKSTLKLLPMALLALIPYASFAGGNSGGGGGGICLENKKCLTLAQAGFRIKELSDERNSLLSYELITEVNRVISLLPAQLKITGDEVIGKKSDIREVQIEDRKKMKTFIKEYQQLLTENGDANLAKNVELMGFTTQMDNAKITFIVFDKFDALDLRGQALILLHEFLLRSKKFSLKDALIFDGVVLDYLTALEANKRPDASGMIKVIEKLRDGNDLTITNSFSLNEALIGNKPLEIANNELKRFGSMSYMSLSYNQILQLSKSYPKMKFVKDTIAMDLFNRSRIDYANDFLSYLIKDLSNFRQVVLNKEYFETFLSQYEDYSTPLNVCASYTDQSGWVVANEIEKDFSFPYRVYCGIDSRYVKPEYPVYPETFERIFKNIDGASIKFEKDLICRLTANRRGTSIPEVSCK